MVLRRDKLIDSCNHLVDSVADHLTNRGLKTNTFNAFAVLLKNSMIEDVAGHLSQDLSASKKPWTSGFEFWRFLAAHKMLMSQLNMSTDLAWKTMLELWASKHGFALKEQERHTMILHRLCAHSLERRSPNGSDEVWLQQKNSLRNINPLEKGVFKQSSDTLFNKKNGVLVINDELIASRADDVETKTVSARKKGKDGPVADCILDSVAALHLGMRLHIKGKCQQESVEKLLETLPKITSVEHQPFVCFDRVHGKLAFVVAILKLCFNIIATIANGQGGRHSFFAWEKANVLCKTWCTKKVPEDEQAARRSVFQNWMLADDDHLGFNLQVAHKEVGVGDGRTVKKEKTHAKAI